jgi:hypothetical protein
MNEPEVAAVAANDSDDLTLEVEVVETRVVVLSDEEINALPVLKPGTKLEPGGVYVDLNDQRRVPFKALEGQEAGTGNRYVARRDIRQDLWNRLVESGLPFDEETVP